MFSVTGNIFCLKSENDYTSPAVLTSDKYKRSQLLNFSHLYFCRLYNGNTVGQQFGPKCCRGDRIGCGISLDADDGQLTVFFTKNGKEVSAPLLSYQSLDIIYSTCESSCVCSVHSFQLLYPEEYCILMCLQVGSVEIPASPDALYPAVGMHSLGEEVLLDLHADWGMEEDDGQMIVDSHEEDWARLHDVKVTGTVSPKTYHL